MQSECWVLASARVRVFRGQRPRSRARKSIGLERRSSWPRICKKGPAGAGRFARHILQRLSTGAHSSTNSFQLTPLGPDDHAGFPIAKAMGFSSPRRRENLAAAGLRHPAAGMTSLSEFMTLAGPGQQLHVPGFVERDCICHFQTKSRDLSLDLLKTPREGVYSSIAQDPNAAEPLSFPCRMLPYFDASDDNRRTRLIRKKQPSSSKRRRQVPSSKRESTDPNRFLTEKENNHDTVY
jgi:hypothetical protein